MSRLRGTVAALLIISIGITPVWGAPGAAFGTIVAADRAHVGVGFVSVGTTVYGGDRLLTEDTGSVQVRVGAARLLLSSASTAVLAKDETAPAATLTRGTAIFSTANSKAFALHVGSAVIRSVTNDPTIAQVSVVGPNQLTIRSTRGSVTIGVDDDVRVIPEGMAYRIVLNPTEAELAAAQASDPTQADTSVSDRDRQEDRQNTRSERRNRRYKPRQPSRNKFLWFAIGVTAVVTGIALYEALQSPDRPK